MSFLWYSMGWASSGAISTASLIFQIRAKTATALHHPEGRQGRAEQLRRLPGAADRRDAQGRSAHRALRRSAHRGRRTRCGAHRPGAGQCDLRRHRATPVQPALPHLLRQGLSETPAGSSTAAGAARAALRGSPPTIRVPPVSRRFASARRRAQTSASIRPRSQA